MADTNWEDWKTHAAGEPKFVDLVDELDELKDDDHTTLFICDVDTIVTRAQTWMQWARNCIENLRQAQITSIDQLNSSEKTVGELKVTVGKQDEQLRALTTWIDRRKDNSIETLGLGTKVILNTQVNATVSGILMNCAGVRYETVWMTEAGDRRAAVVDSCELTAVESDILPTFHPLVEKE